MRQTQQPQALEQKKVWGLAIRLWHWILMVCVISGWLLGEFRTFSIMQWHIYIGYTIGILLIIRLYLGLLGPATTRFSSLNIRPTAIQRYLKTIFKPTPSGSDGHTPLGSLAVIVLLVLLSAQVMTGLFSIDDAIFFEGPLADSVSETTALQLTHVHHITAKILLVAVIAHVTVIFFYLFRKKENLIKPMITGWKWVEKKSDKEG